MSSVTRSHINNWFSKSLIHLVREFIFFLDCTTLTDKRVREKRQQTGQPELWLWQLYGAVPSFPGVGIAPRVSFIITNDIPLCSVDTCRNRTPSNQNMFTFFFFTFVWPCIVKDLFLIGPTDAIISQIYFVKKYYMFPAVPLPIIRSFPLYIRHWYMMGRGTARNM